MDTYLLVGRKADAIPVHVREVQNSNKKDKEKSNPLEDDNTAF